MTASASAPVLDPAAGGGGGAGRKDSMWRRVRTYRRFWLGAALLVLFGLMAVAPGAFASVAPGSDDPRACSVRAEDGTFQDRLAPSGDHWFGTDALGCDYLTRVVNGARTSMVVALVGVSVDLLLGAVLGGLAGYLRGPVDWVISRAADIFYGMPTVVIATLALSLGDEHRSILEVALVLGLLGWPAATRLVRASVLSVSQEPYVEAARALGLPTRRILARHVLPNAWKPLVVHASADAGLLIAAEATLTFLGIGLQIPAISWGLMVAAGQSDMADHPHLLLFPAVFLGLTVLGFLLVGDAVRLASDPSRRGRRSRRARPAG